MQSPHSSQTQACVDFPALLYWKVLGLQLVSVDKVAANYFFVTDAGAVLLSCATGRTPIFLRSLSRTSCGDGGILT
jgi:hypothetical protein